MAENRVVELYDAFWAIGLLWVDDRCLVTALTLNLVHLLLFAVLF